MEGRMGKRQVVGMAGRKHVVDELTESRAKGRVGEHGGGHVESSINGGSKGRARGVQGQAIVECDAGARAGRGR